MRNRNYYFKRSWRQFKIGDPVPENFDSGMIGTMKSAGIIGDPEPEVKDITAPPNDKMIRMAQRRKATA